MSDASNEALHLAELTYFVNVLRIEQHDVLLLELLDAILLLVRQVYVRVDQDWHLATELVKLGYRPLQGIKGLQNALRVHLLTDLDYDAELVQGVGGEQVWLKLEKALKEVL